jgi:mandelate racemase
LQPLIQGDAVAPLVLAQKLQGRFRLLGPQGFTGIAIAGIDMAAWDLLAKSAGLSLTKLLGGEEKPIPAYHSLGMAGPDGAAREAAESAELGFRCVKYKVGYQQVEQDQAVIQAARGAAGEDLQVMVDYNQSLSVPEAIRRVQLLEEEALVWVEEPTRADDFAGYARIAAAARPYQEPSGWGLGLHDAGRHEDWRDYGLAARGQPNGGSRFTDIQSSLP